MMVLSGYWPQLYGTVRCYTAGGRTIISWAPRARGGKTKRMLPRPAGPAPPGRASLHGWEPYPTRDGAPPPRAGSPQRGGAPLHGQGRSSMGCTTRPDLRPLGSAHHLLRRGPAGAAERVRPGAWVVSSSRACVWRSLASLPRRRASACIWAGSHGLASQGPQQAGHTGHGARRRGTRGRPQQLRRWPVLRGPVADGSGQDVGSQGVGAWYGGWSWGEAGGASRRTPVPAPAPNQGLHLTASSLRSCLAAASGRR